MFMQNESISAELHWFSILGDNLKVKIWLNGYGRACGSIGTERQSCTSIPSGK
jgi:hypothetical protein